MEVNSSQKRKFFKRGYSECAKYPLHETKMGKTPLVQVVDKDKKCRKRSASDEPAGLTCKQKTKNVKQVEKGKLTQPTSPMTDSSSDIEMISTKNLSKWNSFDYSPASPGSDSSTTIPLEDAQREHLETLIDIATSDDEPDVFGKLHTSVEGDNGVKCFAGKNTPGDEVKHSSSVEERFVESGMHPNQEQRFTTLKDSLDLAGNAVDSELSSKTEPGDFAFIDIGGAPLSVSSDPVEPIPPLIFGSPVQGHKVKDFPDGVSKCTTDSTGASKICVVFPDAGVTPNDFQQTTNKFILPDVAGESVQILKCLPSSSELEELSSDDASSSSILSIVAQDDEDDIPPDATTEFLDKKEQKLRNYAKKIKEILAPIDNERKRIFEKREFLKAKIAEQQADLAVRTKVIESMKQTLMSNKEQITRLVGDKNQLSASVTLLSEKSIETEMALHELQLISCQNRLKALRDGTHANSSSLSTSEDEKKAQTLRADIARYCEEEKITKESLILVGNRLTNCTKESEVLGLRITEMEDQQKRAEAAVSENKKILYAATDKLKQLIKKQKLYSASFISLEMTMVKTQTCRKLQELGRKKEVLLGKEVIEQMKARSVQASASSNVQFASQISVFGGSFQPNMLQVPNQPASLNDRSTIHHYTSLQSYTIQHHAPFNNWNLPQPYMPLPPHFPTGLLKIGSVESPVSETQLKQTP